MIRKVQGTEVGMETLDQKQTEDAAHVEKIGISHDNTLKKASDCITILIPQPSDDPEDTLNWSQEKKWVMLSVVAYCAVMPDMQAAFGIPLVPAQAIEWGISIDEAGRSVSGCVFMIGAGSLFSVPLVQRFGRLPVLFRSMFISFWMTVFATLAPSPISFIVARCLQTTFSAAPQVIGLSFIYDLFFFHEHARAIGIWAWAFVESPFIGPLISSIVANFRPWQDAFWVCTAMTGLACILVIMLVHETLYDRDISIQLPEKAAGPLVRRLEMISGAYGARVKGRPSLAKSSMRMLVIASRPYFFLILVFYAMTFMWSVGANTTLSLFLFKPVAAGGYGFSQLSVGLIYFAPITATFLGELFGHYFNDFLARRYMQRHSGVFEPEARLWVVWIATPFMVGGLILLGFCFELHFHWVAIAFAWGIYCFGTLISTVGITAYALDIFKDEAAEAAALINFSRTISGFISSSGQPKLDQLEVLELKALSAL
ncbi:hypothetical protein VE01_05026 [Pseudogymnoascus verrucosus]|uniref:Major facilitator superfamily (MFS) profile domain-containing protein n=1 Tax=Pseudogymnoascus verrucosus TaxID=342668 RepID=A0A1B8GPE1_9PEZI|nr:uncharacterized protein VE01_05026 [Pseudogymnoascus verrucosus]OBT97709.1 hypothetical protein VE01_05026 [Pseudogymnoascus verrucosus]